MGEITMKQDPVINVPFTLDRFPSNRLREYGDEYEITMAIREIEGAYNKFEWLGEHERVISAMRAGFPRGLVFARDPDHDPLEVVADVFYPCEEKYVWRIMCRWQTAFDALYIRQDNDAPDPA
jgi:hypothetical protein